ncbi:MAG: hypothetical protein ACPGAE_13235, partial [Neptuniibacter sp.]
RVYKLAGLSEKRREPGKARQEAGSALGCWGICRNKYPDSLLERNQEINAADRILYNTPNQMLIYSDSIIIPATKFKSISKQLADPKNSPAVPVKALSK